MKAIAVTLPDGSQRSYPGPTTPRQVARDIGKRLEEAAVAAKVDGKVVDLSYPIEKDVALAIVTKESADGLEVLRHSTAHLLAQAIKEIYPTAQITIGPVIEDGFYYDIDCPESLTVEHLSGIEKKMAEIAGRKLEVTRKVLERDAAVTLFRGMGELYKAELIQGFPQGDSITAYEQGGFLDLCRGPHVPNTDRLGKFKLLSVAGAYWRGDEKNKMLQRIYGTAFATQKELDAHLKRLEEARKRDHRRLGPELGLFTFLPIAPAMPFYLPKGALLYNLLSDFMRKETRPLGYQEVICPQMMSSDLWRTSGHLENYKENMFNFDDGEGGGMLLKPMNCPGHAALFASTKHSYKDLPVRYSEFSKLHRNERGGVTHGILRTRTFSQDDAHIFCTEDQIEEEGLAFIQHLFHVYEVFGFDEVVIRLATRPEKFLGLPENFDKATTALENCLKRANREFTYAHGEGAFYGPKIEFHIKDSLARYWQCGTIQVDFNFPERFKLEYTDSESKARRPVMLHRAIFGSLERFMGILIEHHAGHFPLWISPTQATILSVTEGQAEYARETAATLESWGIRTELDVRNEKLGYKIREAQLKRAPLMLVLGQREADNRTLSVRHHTGETLNDLSLEGFRKFLEPLLTPGAPKGGETGKNQEG